MSTIGLYSTLYTRLSECAELLDQTLIQLKQQQQTTISDQQRQLGQLLISLACFTLSKNHGLSFGWRSSFVTYMGCIL